MDGAPNFFGLSVFLFCFKNTSGEERVESLYSGIRGTTSSAVRPAQRELFRATRWLHSRLAQLTSGHFVAFGSVT